MKQGLIALFCRHRVAANLLMIIMIMVGAWALSKLNTQFFPTFELDVITVRVVWSGASAEDVETAITQPLEQELRGLDHLNKITSTSATSVSSITLEYQEGTNMDSALEKVNSVVGRTRQLPGDAEDPIVTRIVRYEGIAKILLSGAGDLTQMRYLAQQIKDDLIARGVSKVDITGLPEEEVSLQVPTQRLYELGLTLEDIALRVRQQSKDIPSGSVGRNDTARQLRALNQKRSVIEFESLPIVSDDAGRLLTLGDIARIERRPKDNEVQLTYNGKPAIELSLSRDENMDALKSARILNEWLNQHRASLPAGVSLHVFDQRWVSIKERISLLLTNGGGGLILVIGILLLFLNRRVAFWVTMGIPVSFLAALAVLYLLGGSINMISLFGLIMALGIIVDDAIVVGEDALTHHQMGEPPARAAEGGALRMLAPVISSSLTTIAAFLPLMLVSGIVGNIMFDIPLVVICVIIASLIECFLILPGHLRHAFGNLQKRHEYTKNHARNYLDGQFNRFKDQVFRPMVIRAIDNRSITIASALAVLIVVAGLVAGGRLGFTFFPNIEGRSLFATVSFTAGSPPEKIGGFLKHLEQTLYETEKEFGAQLIDTAVVRHGLGQSAGGMNVRRGNQHGSVLVEMISSENRDVRNAEFMSAWEKKIILPAGVESFTISERRAGHPGRDIDIRLTGDDAFKLKTAATEISEALKTMPGVSAIEDDLPWGQEQFIFNLTPTGKALGLNVDIIGRQLRAAFDGYLVQLFQDRQDEIEVRVMLPDAERHNLAQLDSLMIILPNGDTTPLSGVVSITTRKGFEVLRHREGQLAVSVSADVDRSVNNNNTIRANIRENFSQRLASQYGATMGFQGRAEDQASTLNDLKRGAVFALAFIYIVLAWVFSSYSKPLIVMAVIPFGLVGAIIGHWIMGIELTILSLFGFFGLSGIVVNDSIILVTFYQKLRSSGMEVNKAIAEAACQRLRAVLLTSLTTIAGLTPLLFETSLQAQFLIPMAVTICFGLAFSTLLVLVVMPAFLSVLESVRARVKVQAAGASA